MMIGGGFENIDITWYLFHLIMINAFAMGAPSERSCLALHRVCIPSSQRLVVPRDCNRKEL
jgi:hypothetical protein